MKRLFKYSIALCGSIFLFSSCELDLYPTTSYSEYNVDVDSESESAITTRELLAAQLDDMYTSMKDMQTFWYQLITMADVRPDNAYGGNMGEAKVVAVESNTIDSDNEFTTSLWDGCMDAIDEANQVICNIDAVKAADASLTDAEYEEWLSEALCWRSYLWITMMQLFGEIPMLTEIPTAITSDNVEEVYPLYFPERVSQETVGEQIVKDIEEYACLYAPDPIAGSKNTISKGFAHGIMARFYALPQFRNWAKVIEHCAAVEAMSYSLCDNYGDLWAYDADALTAAQNLSESIFEVSWVSSTSGSWMWMMFHRNAFEPDSSFDWAKWCTPSRLITAAYDAAGDSERLAASVVYDECTWSYHYSSDNYAFMHKIPTNMSPIYVMRLADIKLLHAEALANNNDISGAAAIVDEIRTRANISALSDSAKASQDAIREAVLEERRLELAFEGHRWFDLMRYDDTYAKLFEVCDAVSSDSYYQTRTAMTAEKVILPIPTTVIDNNPNIEQNPGY